MVISEHKKTYYVVRIQGESGYLYFKNAWEPYYGTSVDDDKEDDDYGYNFDFTSFISSAYPFNDENDSLPKYLFCVGSTDVKTVKDFAKATGGEIIQVERKETFSVI